MWPLPAIIDSCQDLVYGGMEEPSPSNGRSLALVLKSVCKEVEFNQACCLKATAMASVLEEHDTEWQTVLICCFDTMNDADSNLLGSCWDIDYHGSQVVRKMII